MTRILVVGSSVAARVGLETILRDDPRIAIVGEGTRSGDLTQLVRRFRPDLAVMEIGELSSALRSISALQGMGAPAFVVLAPQLTRNELRRALQSGVRAVLPHDVSSAELAAAIEAVSNGLAVISAEDLEVLLPTPSEIHVSDELALGEPLTSRETEVLSMLAEGAGNKEIAARLHISEHTAKFHVSSILAKLGAATRTEAVSRGYREGLILI
ncbi:MAG: response regulator transcription factor [Acidobacteriaceae bacterium]